MARCETGSDPRRRDGRFRDRGLNLYRKIANAGDARLVRAPLLVLLARNRGANFTAKLAHGGVRRLNCVAYLGCDGRSCRRGEEEECGEIHRGILAAGLTNNRAPPTFATRWIDLGSLATRIKKAK